MFLINGVVQDTLAANDRATQFGDGCFTTARIQQGQVALLDAHLQRLQTTCEKLHIPFNDWLTLSEEMQRLARRRRACSGDSHPRRWGRGYSTAGCVSPTRILRFSPYPAHYARWREEGITLTQSLVPPGATPGLPA